MVQIIKQSTMKNLLPFLTPLAMTLLPEGVTSILKLRDNMSKYRFLISLENCRFGN